MTEQPPQSASPAVADGLAIAVTQIYADAETSILAEITLNTRAALDTAGAALQGRSAPTQTTVRRILDHTEALARLAVAGVLSEAYRRGHGAEKRTVEHAVRNVLERLTALRFGVMQWVSRLLNRLSAAMRAPDPRAGADRILQRAASRGIIAFVSSRGSSVGLVSYVDQSVRHAAGNAAMDGYLARISEAGDYVIVSRSETSCPICRPWVGRILSISGADPKRPSVARARSAGLWHPNCVHTIFRWYPGFKWGDNAALGDGGTESAYLAVQRQRAIERSIRQWKRRQAAALDDTTRMAAGRKVRQWQAELRRHLAAEHLKRSRMRERTDFGHTRPLKHALGA